MNRATELATTGTIIALIVYFAGVIPVQQAALHAPENNGRSPKSL